MLAAIDVGGGPHGRLNFLVDAPGTGRIGWCNALCIQDIEQ